MADIKAMIKERVENGATLVNNAIIKSISFGDIDNNDRCTAIIRLNRRIPAMVPVTQQIIDSAEEKAIAAENAAKVRGASDEVKETAASARAYADSLVVGEYILGESDVIFSSNYELLGIIRNNAKTAGIADVLAESLKLLKTVFLWGNTSILCDPVIEGQLYQGVFSTTTSVVERNSIFHTLLNVKFHEEAEDLLEELKRDYRKLLLQQAMEKMKKDKKDRRSRDRDDDAED